MSKDQTNKTDKPELNKPEDAEKRLKTTRRGLGNGEKKKRRNFGGKKDKGDIDHNAWKDERTHFEKSSSRVGPDFQVSMLPVAGSHSSSNSEVSYDGGALYQRVWDPAEAERLGRLNFVHTRVKFNRKESAYNMFHSRSYRLPGFYNDVSAVVPSDCSDWTKEDKERFRSAIFEHHENMKEVSKMMDKPLGQCITYYLVAFKRTKSYKSLKRKKAKVNEGSIGTLVCNECRKGGMLIACDTCESHYHLTCTTPPLDVIPEGTWNCFNCKRETRSMLSSQDETSYNSDQVPDGKTSGDSIEGLGYVMKASMHTKRKHDLVAGTMKEDSGQKKQKKSQIGKDANE
ncbi:hypothetical protein ACHAWF_008952 [Thalassiosira exigua]